MSALFLSDQQNCLTAAFTDGTIRQFEADARNKVR